MQIHQHSFAIKGLHTTWCDFLIRLLNTRYIINMIMENTRRRISTLGQTINLLVRYFRQENGHT